MNRSPSSAGSLLALSIIVGAILGIAKGQPSIGILGGTVVGALICVAVWLRDRRR